MRSFVILIIFIICFGTGTLWTEEYLTEENGSDYLAGILEFFIDIDFKYDTSSIYKIFSTETTSPYFIPDFIGHENFRITDLWRKEFNENNTRSMDGGIKSSENRQVFIAYTKNDLIEIEKEYINSEYLKEIDEEFFEDNNLVIIIFHFIGWTYPKNWKIDEYNGKYLFSTEIWNRRTNFIILLATRAMFLIKIEK